SEFPTLKNPSGIPAGAVMVGKDASYQPYTYKKSLPGGGSVSRVFASTIHGNNIVIEGTDNNGVVFRAKYIVSNSSLQYVMSSPTFITNDISVLYDIGKDFSKAYGM